MKVDPDKVAAIKMIHRLDPHSLLQLPSDAHCNVGNGILEVHSTNVAVYCTLKSGHEGPHLDGLLLNAEMFGKGNDEKLIWEE